MKDGVDTTDGFTYVLVILDDMSSDVKLRPARACTANFVPVELMA